MTDAERLEKIRDTLAAFDWETGDRQLALEEIERLAFNGWDSEGR